MKYQAIAELYAVYRDAKADPTLAAEIEAHYSAQGHPKTDLLTNMVLWIGFADGIARQRISEMHRLLLECEKQGKQPSDLVDWFTTEGGWRKVLSHASRDNASRTPPNKTKASKAASSGGASSSNSLQENADRGKLFKALSGFDAEAKFQSSSAEPPIPVSCDVGEYLVQICRKVGSGSFLTYWVKVTQTELEPIKTSTLTQQLANAA